jgi:hypothetical protein
MSDTTPEVKEFEIVPQKEASGALTPIELLQIAVQQGADVEKLGKLMDLQERWQANEAKMAFNAAMRKFKANPPEITKNKKVEFGNTLYKHATLDHVCDVVTKALSDVGISHAWKVNQQDGVIAVSCVLTHEMGHSESTQLMGNPDTSGSKNAVQAIGSTVTYLQRYTLLAACGLAAANDTDGVAPERDEGEAAKLDEYLRQITEVETQDDLKKVFGKAFNEAAEVNDKDAMAKLIQAKNKRKAEIG